MSNYSSDVETNLEEICWKWIYVSMFCRKNVVVFQSQDYPLQYFNILMVELILGKGADLAIEQYDIR